MWNTGGEACIHSNDGKCTRSVVVLKNSPWCQYAPSNVTWSVNVL